MFVQTWNDVTCMLREIASRISGIADDTAPLAGEPARDDLVAMIKSTDQVVIGLMSLEYIVHRCQTPEPWRQCVYKGERVYIRRNTTRGGWDAARCETIAEADAVFEADGWRCDDEFVLANVRMVAVDPPA